MPATLVCAGRSGGWRFGCHHFSRCIECDRQVLGPQRGQEPDQCRGLRGAECIAIGGPVASTLQHLTNDLILRHTVGDAIQCGSAKSAFTADRMAIATLLVLKQECALTLEGRAILKVRGWNGIGCPCVHDWAP